MTNKEDAVDQNCDPRMAGVLAVHLVSQVLDEAVVIANAASESGQPWRYYSVMKNLSNNTKVDEIDMNDDVSSESSNRDEDEVGVNKTEALINNVITSTPQKSEGPMPIVKTGSILIGQGDEGIDIQRNDLTNTSTYINHLFDMSEVERVIFCDDNEFLSNYPEDNNIQDINKIMESYVNNAFTSAIVNDIQENGLQLVTNFSTGNEYYEFSYESDAVHMIKDDAFYIDEGDSKKEISEVAVIEDAEDTDNKKIIDEIAETNNTALYENAYLTLNRDYEQCSDEEGEPILQDPKSLTMLEVDLMTAHTSENNLPHGNVQTYEEPATTASVSATVSRRSRIMHQWRARSARLFACMRKWWTRKTPGKRKESRGPGSIHGLCPLSPDARRRTASLLDQRHLRTPSPSRPIVWKYNTVNEALINSSHWKEYTFDKECGE